MAVAPQRTSLVAIERWLLVLLFSLLENISLLAEPIFLCAAQIETYGLVLKVSLEGACIPMPEKKCVAIVLPECIAFRLEPFVLIHGGGPMLGDCSIVVNAGLP
jgi:hypothetical protein